MRLEFSVGFGKQSKPPEALCPMSEIVTVYELPTHPSFPKEAFGDNAVSLG